MKMRFLEIFFISAALILSVSSYPRPYYYHCNNWCPQNYYVVCCDNWNNGDPVNPNNNMKTYCPIANCTSSTVFSGDCTSDDDCKRKEMCCENPCLKGKKMCAEHVKKDPIVTGCKAITNCQDWLSNNNDPVSCKDDDDCKRSETCCTVPCKSQKVCQKTEKSNTMNTGTATNTGLICC